MSDQDWVSEAQGSGAVLRYPDPDHAAEMRLWCDLDLGPTEFDETPEGWQLTLDDLPVDRLEYLLVADGEHRLDPGNPRVVPGAFGEHSWLPLAGYTEPAWVGAATVPGSLTPVTVDDTPVGPVEAGVWVPDGVAPDQQMPLLLCHDGPEMAAYGELLGYVAAAIAAGWLPPVRVGLLTPGPRDERYAANPAYARALTRTVVPALCAAAPTAHRPVLMGQSLGALAALHAAWTAPATFAGLFCQSGSFFTPDLDPQERDYSRFAEVTGFVASVLAARRAAPGAPPMTLVCGSAEENRANNARMHEHLGDIGVDVGWAEVRDGHTWTCWRDLLHPHLTDLLRKAWT